MNRPWPPPPAPKPPGPTRPPRDPNQEPPKLRVVDPVASLPRRTYSVAEVAQMLGATEAAVRRLIRSGELGALKPGKEYRVPIAEFERWLSTAVLTA